MMETIQLRKIALGAVACFAAGCASTGITVEKPSVSLRTVEVADIGLGGQTFVLDFDVVNPNPFPLPIRTISYGVELDGFRFAETVSLTGVEDEPDGRAPSELQVAIHLQRLARMHAWILVAMHDQQRRFRFACVVNRTALE